jgi:integrase
VARNHEEDGRCQTTRPRRSWTRTVVLRLRAPGCDPLIDLATFTSFDHELAAGAAVLGWLGRPHLLGGHELRLAPSGGYATAFEIAPTPAPDAPPHRANPVKDAVRVRRSRGRHNVWKPEQLKTFLTAARTERLYAMWLMFATTGIRRSEAAGALIDQLDLGARTLTVLETRVVAAGKARASDGKSAQSRRVLALDRRTAAALAAHLEVLDDERKAFGGGYSDHGLLFCWPDGRPIHPDSEQFNRLVDRAAVPRIRPHDVRHTYATMSLRAGVNPKIVSQRLGHATVAFTLDVYTEDVPDLHHDAAEIASDLFLGTEADPRGADGSDHPGLS